MLQRMRVKMCGMTRMEDMEHAINLGVDALGIIFYAPSPRSITIKKAKKLLHSLPPFITVVAVVVNPELDFVRRLVDELPIQLIQFHGDEEAEWCQKVPLPYIKALHPLSAAHIMHAAGAFHTAQALLLDTPSAARGGSGSTFDWRIIPSSLDKPYILAGGLNEFNIRDAVTETVPYAVDVCSGIEAAPGIKDHLKMSRFMAALREVDNA